MENRNLVISINIALVIFVLISKISAQGQLSQNRIFFGLFFNIIFCDVTSINCESKWSANEYFRSPRKKKWQKFGHHICNCQCTIYVEFNVNFIAVFLRNKSCHNEHRENNVDIPKKNWFCQLLDLEHVLAYTIFCFVFRFIM